MKKRKAAEALLIIAAAAALFLISFRHAVYTIFKNLTVETYTLPEEDSWNGGKTLRNIRYSDVSESDYLDLYIPGDVSTPRLFVIIHGGGFIAGDSQTKQAQLMYRFFRDKGYACASVNYRLAEEAPFPAALEDCKAAIRFLRANAEKYGYDAEQIAVFGESAGGYLALMCSVTDDNEFSSVPFIGQTDSNNPSSKVDVLVDYYGYTDIDGLDEDLKTVGLPRIVYNIANNWMNGKLDGYEDYASYWFRKNISEMSGRERDTVDPYYYIDKNRELVSELSVWMIHGDCDMTIPYPSSERLYSRLAGITGKERIQFRLEPDMGHASDPLYSGEILSEIDTFIKSQMPQDQITGSDQNE